MPSYLVEGYLTASGKARLAALARRAHALEAGEGIRHLGSLVLLEDEICFHIFEAPSAAALVEASRRAGLEYDRIVETTWIAGTPARKVVESA